MTATRSAIESHTASAISFQKALKSSHLCPSIEGIRVLAMGIGPVSQHLFAMLGPLGTMLCHARRCRRLDAVPPSRTCGFAWLTLNQALTPPPPLLPAFPHHSNCCCVPIGVGSAARQRQTQRAGSAKSAAGAAAVAVCSWRMPCTGLVEEMCSYVQIRVANKSATDGEGFTSEEGF